MKKRRGEARFKRRATAALSTIDRIKVARRLKQGRASVVRLPRATQSEAWRPLRKYARAYLNNWKTFCYT